MSRGLAGKVERLRTAFLSQLPGRLSEARTLLAGLAGGGDGDFAGRLRLVLHNLKGAAATFGLKEISESARAAEDLLLQWSPEDRDRHPVLATAMADHLAAMEAAWARAPVGAALPGASGTESEDEQQEARAATGRLVYVCDDDPIVAEYLCSQLAGFGYELRSFGSLAAVRDGVTSRRPDALVIAAVFAEGELAGFDLVDEIQRSGAPIPTLFLSSRDDFDARLRAVRGGGAGYFTKPVRVMELVGQLDRLTSGLEPDPLRVLIVDDEPEVAAYHAAVLDQAGLRTRIETAPRRVLDVLGDFAADLVLMDVHMPGCSGRELAQIIRQIPAHISLPIVFLSAETDSGKQESALRVGGDGFLTKPIEPEHLVSAVVLRAERMRALAVTMEELRVARDRAEDALARLTRAQEALVQAEKLASLGSLVVGIAHEINTPLGIAMTCVTHLADTTARLRRLFEADDIGIDDFERYLTGATDATDLIVANCDRAGRLIQSFKQVAVDRSSETRRSFDLAVTIDEILRSLGPNLQREGHRVAVECPAGLLVDGYPGALSQVLSNLVMNSMVHGYDQGVGGRLTVTVDQPEPGMVRLVYRDDGRGIAAEHLGQIFDPFFTTRRGSGGAGLGLHIVYNLMTGPMQGQVAVASEAGDGAAFTLSFPQSVNPYRAAGND